jgi:hypothetical protein
LLTIAGRLCLPAPPMVIASCTLTIALLATSAGLLVAGLSSSNSGYGIAAFLLGLAALLCLAFTAITVAQAAEPPRAQRRRRLRRRRRSAGVS